VWVNSGGLQSGVGVGREDCRECGVVIELVGGTMNISLKPEHEEFIKSQVLSGRFANQEEVIDMAFRLLKKLQGEYEQWIEETRNKIDVGIAELDRGEGLDGDAVVAGILERFK
jgi:antitoxin ParD1/3/4